MNRAGLGLLLLCNNFIARQENEENVLEEEEEVIGLYALFEGGYDLDSELTMDGFLCTNTSSVKWRYFELEKKHRPNAVRKRLHAQRISPLGLQFDRGSWPQTLESRPVHSIDSVYHLYRNARNTLFHRLHVIDAHFGALLYCAKKILRLGDDVESQNSNGRAA
ncbi:hypothetical protein BC937DRAFT_86789 [Endogone sp. FLAS-F59071]|nr:hypothetical protein BC937DRAFT_86789 [Endogone sp. FLAS-F59071]|eukprot:RUS19866.1 hypothetical protein BC937DRAFT_86789 [Endogone sp. FLAS-F59071]